MKTYEVSPTYQKSVLLEIENKTHLILIIYVKAYGFLSFSKNMDNSLSDRYGQRFFDDKKN